MNQELIEMAKEAGFEVGKMIAHDQEFDWVWPKENARKSCVFALEAFAALAAAAEREACAKVCDVLSVHPEYASDITKLAALEIRARGK